MLILINKGEKMRPIYVYPWFGASNFDELHTARKIGFTVVHARVLMCKNGPVIWREEKPPGETLEPGGTRHHIEELREHSGEDFTFGPAPKLVDFLKLASEIRVTVFLECQAKGGFRWMADLLKDYKDRVVLFTADLHDLEWATFPGFQTCAVIEPDGVTPAEVGLEHALRLKPSYVAVNWHNMTKGVSLQMRPLTKDVPLLAIDFPGGAQEENLLRDSAASGVLVRDPLSFTSRLGFIAA
jgi:hypothetical protein